MANSIIPFPDNGNLPAYLTKVKTNFAAFYAGVGPSFPILSILGKNFTLVRNGERHLIPDPNDPESPAQALNVVILDGNPVLTKVFYLKAYESGSTERPDCYSNDGTHPAPDAPTPQAKSCAACPHNVFGSGKEGRGKACQDNRRLAVAPAGRLDDPMLLRIPPTSLRPLAEYAGEVEQRGVPMAAVVTKIRFDPTQPTPKLMFRREGLLDEEGYNKAIEVAGSDLVRQILGVPEGAPSAATPPVSDAITGEGVDEALKAAAQPTPKAEPKPKAESKAESKPKAESKSADPLVSKVEELLSEFED
jgi:hypothetical protein